MCRLAVQPAARGRPPRLYRSRGPRHHRHLRRIGTHRRQQNNAVPAIYQSLLHANYTMSVDERY